MTPEGMKARTREFAVRAMKLVDALPKRRSADVIGGQLLRSATSVGANYRAACRARSHAEFIAKIGTVEEEADESGYWLELTVAGELIEESRVKPLLNEASELTAIMVRSITTARGKRARTSASRSSRESATRNPPSATNPQSAILNPHSLSTPQSGPNDPKR